ncbi:hypothetical protein NFI96_018385, partial [Prochilodus magdalenae]
SESESEDTPHSEPCTPPHLLKAKRKYSSTRSRKKTTSNPEPFEDRSCSLYEEDPERHVTANTNGKNSPTWSAGKSFIAESNSSTQPDSFDSHYSLSALLPTTSSSRTAGSSVDQESPCQGLGSQCSVCEDRTGSEDGSLGSRDLDTPPSGSFLLKDRMLGILPPLAKKQLPASPMLPQTPLLPHLSLLAAEEGLNLSPSLLTSPARGLSHPLLPNRQEELQMLFEDVWVTPKSSDITTPKFPCKSLDGSCVSLLSEEDNRGSDEMTWTPKQHIPERTAKKAHHRRFFNKSHNLKHSTLKKKCVNGFIMFCRVNRRLYLSIKARHFSRQHNRNVRSEGQDADEDAEDYVLSPLHMLLAYRDL